MANEYPLSLTGEEGSRLELQKKTYDSNVIRHFLPDTFAYAMIQGEDLMGGVSKDITRRYKMVTHKKVDHANTPRQNLIKKIVTIRLEDDETISASNYSIKDEMVTHYDASGEMAAEAGQAMAQLYEVQSMRQGILAARTAADGNFPGGQQVTEALATDIPGTYPLSVVGSKKLQDNIKAAHLLMFEDNVPDSMEKYWFMKKREHNVLQQDDTLMSTDYVGRQFADKIKGKLLMIDGAWIIPTNNYPQADYSTADAETPTKNGTDAYLVDASDSVALCFTSLALRKAAPENITGLYYWDNDRRDWTIGAVGFKTIEIYRPECAAEIRVA